MNTDLTLILALIRPLALALAGGHPGHVGKQGGRLGRVR